MTVREIAVHHDAAELAQAVAARLTATLVEAQAERGEASVVLTGGRVGGAVLAELGRQPLRDALDWSRLHLWWGDERFLPSGHADRNETQAREALLDAVPLDPARIHPMPASDGPDGDDAEAAAARYAAELTAAARGAGTNGELPAFDVLLLGVGEDGHVASLFPGFATLRDQRTTASVHDSPKPPPTRITLTFRAIRSARQVWLFAAGEGKADAVGLVFAGAGELEVPAVGATGTARTLWLLDRAAAAKLPPDLTR